MGRSKTPKNIPLRQGKEARNTENPTSIMQQHPAWNFNRIDKEGSWPITETSAGEDFWSIILPRLSELEKLTWGEILIAAKKGNHSISVETLNQCAQKRLTELNLYIDEVVSLRINATYRLYGFLSATTYVLLWYDKGHGDNDTCVCRSHKKGT